MTQILPRFYKALEAIEDERLVARIVLEAGPSEQPQTIAKATLPGDTRRLRGIPCVARGVSGVSPGTDPLAHVLRTIRR